MSFPSNWLKRSLGDLCNMQSGGTPSRTRADFYDGDIPWAKIGDLETGIEGFVIETEEYITKAGLESINNRVFEKGTLLLAIYGSVGKVAFAGIQLSTNQAILGLQPKSNTEIDLNFLKYWFISQKSNLLHGARGVALKNLSASIVKAMQIYLPPFIEQQKIATILDAAESLRQKDQRLVERYTTLSQSLFLEMFGDPVTNPKGWGKKLFLDVFDTKTGKLDSNAASVNGSYPFFTCAKEVLSIDTYSYDAEVLLLAGNNAAGIFDVKYYKGKFDAYQRTYILSIKDKQLTYPFMQISLEKKLKDLQRLSIGSSTQYLTMKILGRLEFITPPIALQNQFVERIQLIEAQKQQAQSSLEKSEALFNSLLHRAFTGELTAKMAA